MWSAPTDKPFQHLKCAFTTAPILKHPDPEQPLPVEVDTSDTVVGTVLSQHFGKKNQLMHRVAFFLKKLLQSGFKTWETENY